MSQLNVDTLGAQTGTTISVASGDTLRDASGNTISGGGLVKLASTTASSDSSVIFDNFVNHTNYSYYHVVFNFIKLGTDNQNWQVTFRQGGASGSDITGTYRRYNNYYK